MQVFHLPGFTIIELVGKESPYCSSSVTFYSTVMHYSLITLLQHQIIQFYFRYYQLNFLPAGFIIQFNIHYSCHSFDLFYIVFVSINLEQSKLCRRSLFRYTSSANVLVKNTIFIIMDLFDSLN